MRYFMEESVLIFVIARGLKTRQSGLAIAGTRDFKIPRAELMSEPGIIT